LVPGVYVASTGALEMHVNLPNISSSVDTVFYLAFGDAGLTTDGTKKAAWNTTYAGVWHYPNGSSLTLGDSTVNGNSGTGTNASAASGMVDGAASFTGSDPSYVKVSAAPLPTFPMTYSCWAKLTGATWADGVAKVLIGQIQLSSLDAVYFRYERTDANGGYSITGISQNSIASTSFEGIYLLTPDTSWHLLGVKFDTYQTVSFYVDGVAHAASATFTTGSPPTTHTVMDSTFTGEILYNTSSAFGPFDGSLDEIRLRAAAATDAEMAADYNAQKASSTFLTWGSRVPLGVTGRIWVLAGNGGGLAGPSRGLAGYPSV
jgi:hypothetical protein